jgi:Cd2+/Zn2+-exporting ATPase
MVLALVAILTGGLSTYKKGWIALKNGNLNINALMSIAVTGAMLIGHWPEAAMVMVLFALAEGHRGQVAGPRPQRHPRPDANWRRSGHRAAADGSGARWMPSRSRSAVVRVRPGERIALDGVLSPRATRP